MPPETCAAHPQFDHEIKELLVANAELKADVRNLTYEFGRFEKAMTAALCEIRMDLQTQRDADSKRDVQAATQAARTSFLWTFFVDKNGLIILGILAWVVLGQVI